MKTATRQLARLRLAIGGLVLVAGLAFGGTAVRAYMFQDCIAECGPCVVWALNCDSCSGYANENSCAVFYSGCTEAGCDCGGDPGWYCWYC